MELIPGLFESLKLTSLISGSLFMHLDTSPQIYARIYNSAQTYENHVTRGRILGRNWDKSLKSFPPCYSQSPLLPLQTDIILPSQSARVLSQAANVYMTMYSTVSGQPKNFNGKQINFHTFPILPTQRKYFQTRTWSKAMSSCTPQGKKVFNTGS